MPAWEPDLAEVRARYEALDAGDFGSAVEQACEWRLADPFSGFFLPLPPVAQELLSAHGSWRLGDGDPHERPDSVALDASGRPVAHVLERGGGFERAKHLWWWDQDGSLLEVELLGGGPHVRRARAIDGRWAHIATVSASVDETVQTLTWRDGRAVRSDVASVYADGGGWASARTAEFNADARLLRIRETRDRGSGDVPACLEQAARLVPEEVVWDARIHAPEAWPGSEAALARAAPLAAARAERLAAALPRRHSRHWLGGHVTGVQGEPLDRDTTLLLSLEEDGNLGFSFLDAGMVQFRIPPDALARHDFTRAITFGDSG